MEHVQIPAERELMPHERLKAYQEALDLALIGEEVAALMGTRPDLADQMRRASASVPLNTAEGAGEYRSAEKARFYRIARRSTTECAAILDIGVRLGLLDRSTATRARALCRSTGFLLTRLAQSLSARAD